MTPCEAPKRHRKKLTLVFHHSAGDRQRTLMEEKLRNIIKAAIESNSLFKRDWDRVPLPQLDPPAPAYTKPAPKPAPQPAPAPAATKKPVRSNEKNDPFRNVGVPDAATRKAEERKARFSKDAEFQRPMYQDITQVRTIYQWNK